MNKEYVCSACGKDTFQTRQAFASHRGHCGIKVITQELISLRQDNFSDQFGKLSLYNKFLIESLELFEADRQAIDEQHRRRRTREIKVHDVGFRCKYCAKKNKLTSGSVSYPGSFECMVRSMCNIANRHLLLNCPSISSTQRGELKAAKKTSRSESKRKGRIALETYLSNLCTFFGLTDNKQNDGVRRIGRPAATPA